VAVGTWSGWSGKSETRFDWLDTARLGKRAIDKAAHNAIPLDLDPGKYTVILEPAAVADLVWWVLRMMDARSAEESRSFLSRKGGGTRLGEALFDEKVTVYSDPNDPIAPEPVFGEDGLPQRRTVWIDGGIVRNLVRSRFWAKKTGREPVARPRSFVMAGGSAPIDQMIRDTRRNILVTRVWYSRSAKSPVDWAHARRQFLHRKWPDRRSGAQPSLQRKRNRIAHERRCGWSFRTHLRRSGW
jgi:predicted Zn-dependent protease